MTTLKDLQLNLKFNKIENEGAEYTSCELSKMIGLIQLDLNFYYNIKQKRGAYKFT